MAVEIEKKYRLTEEQRRYVRDELSDNAANFKGEEFEENIVYGGGVLDELGAILRIRKTANKTMLTFKKRIENETDVKQQTEHESEFANADAVAEILAELGFKPRIIYEKRRETWLFRSVEIVIDELPFGLFMEIEGSITSIKEAEMILGLEGLETEQETYPRLAARLGIEKDGVFESRFPSN